MAWVVPQYSRAEVDEAGRDLAEMWDRPSTLAEGEAQRFWESWEILNNWRSSHSFPLNTFQSTLRGKARKVFANAIVAQRIKRAPTIIEKLCRLPRLSLSTMQDVGGCRAVVGSSSHVFRLRDDYLASHLRHDLVREANYIEHPKPSGYRGIHLIYRYQGEKSTVYNGLQIEMQLRSRLQHAWATAVETAGTFLQRALKSSQGPAEWLEFFAYVSSAFAGIEGTPSVPGTPTDRRELRRCIRERAKTLEIVHKLSAFGVAAEQLARDDAYKQWHYFLLELRPDKNRVDVRGFSRQHLEQANAAYALTEQRIAGEGVPGVQAVLVSVDKLASLRKAYPNFYLDTTAFLKYLQQVM